MKITLGLLVMLSVLVGCSCPPSPEPSPASPPVTVPAPPPSSPTSTPEVSPPESETEYSLMLAQKFCPVIYLNGETGTRENFEPDTVELMVRLSLLRNIADPGFSRELSVPQLSQWSESDYYLDVRELNPKPPALHGYQVAYNEAKTGYPPTVYARIVESPGETVVQYWLFYYLNDWRNIHEGDWELVQLHFAGLSPRELIESNHSPVFAAYSQHQAGQQMAWTDMLDQGLVEATHPLVYVARGSHANYFKPGQSWSILDFDDTGLASWRVIPPEQIQLQMLTKESEWLDFQGYWGEYLGLSVSVLGLTFGQRGPTGPKWSEAGSLRENWSSPGSWGSELPLYPKPFWNSLIPLPDWSELAIFSIFSPAQLHVYDGQGRHVGLDERGTLETMIPGAIYIQPEGTQYKTIIVPGADVTDGYTVEITGTDTGRAEIKALVPDADRKLRHFLSYAEVPVTAATVARVQIRPELLDVPGKPSLAESVRESNVMLELDTEGDGSYELEAGPGVFEENRVDRFDLWWEEYKKPFSLNLANYPGFLRGVWASRLDEARSYLLNAEKLRGAGVDTVMLGIDVVLDPKTGDPKSLGDDAFIFYLQALKKAGFRIILVPNPMHPNLDMGLGYEWDKTDSAAGYRRGNELIAKFNQVVVKWAQIAQQYDVYGFAPLNEPFKLVRDYRDSSGWLQGILPRIRKAYQGRIIAVDTMYDTGNGMSVPYPYDYHGYDLVLGGPPAGRKDVKDWETMLNTYIEQGLSYVEKYGMEGFGIYEWGGYTGGAWYEDEQMALFDQVLSQEQARQILEAGIRQADGRVIASFPRTSIGWVEFDTPSFKSLTEWYRQLGEAVKPPQDEKWTYEELIRIEKELAGADYKDIFQLEAN